jgi:hypothetical protein
MKVECVINGQVRMIIYPENEMETEIIKQLMKQDNTLMEVRSSIQLLGKNIHHAMIVERRNTNEPPIVVRRDDSTQEENM